MAVLAAGCAGSTLAAVPPPAATAVTHYVLAPGAQTLGFTFTQEGAATEGVFKKFQVSFAYDANNLAASSLDVQVQIESLSTDYEDRDAEIRGADIFDAVKFPLGEYHAKFLVKSVKGIEAVGTLAVRGVTHELRIPLAIRAITVAGKPGLELSGNTSLKRLDYGVGHGEWAATETIANDIGLRWKVQLVPVTAPTAR